MNLIDSPYDSDRAFMAAIGVHITKEVAMQVAEAMSKAAHATQPAAELRERVIMGVQRQFIPGYSVDAKQIVEAADILVRYIQTGITKEPA